MTQIQEPLPEVDLLARAVVEASIEVHRHLGPGFLEGVCEEALGIELSIRRIPFERQRPITVNYSGSFFRECDAWRSWESADAGSRPFIEAPIPQS